ncbi:M48 family metallopeptidase [Tessaracoccus sp. MC1865]|uniref:M48 family metallopeptidase n=1 Tax=Tessaracoccus sp. MC1865 TaxID=2760310 RepID=UPI0016046F7B|nr:SprT family zinc-dependent metalloprotease [Tessaracoccus sp. MC1865]MBB1484811.1 M48 family metallopeptidase [Tessaracoccus sp. MC1865]QTO38786.1 M48 family metallopeptidase [Tessaracoccus sp. MC1865]
MTPRRPHASLLQVGSVSAEVTYKPIKSLRMRVVPPDGVVKISVPLGLAEETVTEFVRSHERWLLKARQQVRLAHPPEEPLTDGGRARLWGRWHEVRTGESAKAGARLEDGVLVLSGPDEDARRRGLENLYRRELRAALPGLFALWEPQVGRRHATVKLRRMTSRWGTCNVRTAAITFNTALAEHPPTALEYVVVHELMHLIERGHGPRFVAGMDRLLPEWRQRRKALKGHP